VRQEIVALHRSIFRRNRERINQAVFGYTTAFRRYEQEYARGVKRYLRQASFDELDSAFKTAAFTYVGDYHTLAQAQRGFLRLVRRLPATRPVTLALELVPARHQAALDDFMAGRLAERAFLEIIERHAEWVRPSWENLRELFELARLRGYRVVGIDATGRGPAGATLAARDRLAARLLAREHRAHPDSLVLVLIGELHIAPSHLPATVAAALASARVPAPRSLIVYQNCEEVYWQLEQRGLEHDVELVHMRRDEYCLINTPPIVCQQSFLNWIEVDEGALHLEAPEENFKEYARLVANFFDLPLGDALDEVEVATVVDLSFLSRLRRRGDFADADMREIKKQILRSESYYIPRARMVYLGNLSLNHAAEEASHFVRHACAPIHEPRQLVDAFYARCIEEALGFLGSKLINHKRKCAHAAHFEQVAKSRGAKPQERELARLVLMHARMEDGEKVRGLSRIYATDADLFNAVTHVLGYRLGDRLYYALVGDLIGKQELREIFLDTLEDEGEALATYLYLIGRLRGLKVPTRF